MKNSSHSFTKKKLLICSNAFYCAIRFVTLFISTGVTKLFKYKTTLKHLSWPDLKKILR